MKPYKTVLLIALVLLPIATLFTFDAKFTRLQDSVCANSKLKAVYMTSCSYPERDERERLITTAFYRHIGDYLGRAEGTSPSWLDLDTADANSWFALEGDTGFLQYGVHQRIGDFNREFVIAMFLSVIVAAVAGTLLVQELIRIYKTRKGRPAHGHGA